MTLATLPSRSSADHRVRLDGDRWATIRSIESSDADGLFDFYARLSPAACVARFLGASRGIDARAAAAFAATDHARSDGLIAVLHERGPADGAIIGHACLVPNGAGGDEVAVAVADGFRGSGIGTALMDAAVRSARRRGVPRLTATLRMLAAGPRVATDEIDAGIEEIALDLAA
jgi:GNAT superfamily N-acetyltransferase